MISGKVKERLTPETILNKITEYDIFKYYMPGDWTLNKPTYSPFRKENNPSFVIGNKRGYLSFIDFADTDKRGNCFHFVQMLHGLNSFDETLKLIDKDFGLGILSAHTGDYKRITATYKQPHLERRYSLIQVKTRKFNKDELAYWNQYHQDIQDLRDNNVYAISAIYYNKSKFPLSDTELRFGYLYEGQYWKIYRPFADRKNKWMPNNVPITCMDGKEDIKNCKVAFINKSKKDYMVMKKVFPCSCAVQNEGIGCFSPENVEFLKANSDVQILSFDSDVTGVANSQQITKLFEFGYCNVPRKYLSEGIKDWADLVKTHGYYPVENYLRQKGIL